MTVTTQHKKWIEKKCKNLGLRKSAIQCLWPAFPLCGLSHCK